jgi:hypothetical protein
MFYVSSTSDTSYYTSHIWRWTHKLPTCTQPLMHAHNYIHSMHACTQNVRTSNNALTISVWVKEKEPHLTPTQLLTLTSKCNHPPREESRALSASETEAEGLQGQLVKNFERERSTTMDTGSTLCSSLWLSAAWCELYTISISACAGAGSW